MKNIMKKKTLRVVNCDRKIYHKIVVI